MKKNANKILDLLTPWKNANERNGDNGIVATILENFAEILFVRLYVAIAGGQRKKIDAFRLYSPFTK